MQTKLDRVTIYSNGFLHCSVCSDLEDVKEIERIVNLKNLCGTEHGWMLAREKFRGGKDNPCPCDRHPETHKHYLFEC